MADATITELTVNNNLSAVNYIPISDGVETTRLGTNSLFGCRNRIINGNFSINQRAATVGATDSYTLDRWICVNQTANTTITQQTNQADGIPFNIRIANGITSQKFGIAQYIESANCRDLRGKQVTLSFLARTSSLIPIRYGIINWTGTADTITTPIITTFVTPPTVATGGTLNITVSTLPAINTWNRLTYTFTNTSNMNNIIPIIMSSQTAGNANSNIDIANVQLEEGPTATPFEFRTISTELAMCQRYYEILTADSEGVALTSYVHNSAPTISNRSRWHFKVTKRISPTVNLVSGSWVGVTPTIYPSVESAGFSSAAGLFATSHTVGAPALYAAAEL